MIAILLQCECMNYYIYILKKNGPTIINKNSGILFPSVLNTVVVISFFLLVLLLISSSSFFVLAVDMPPPSTPPPTTTEKPGTPPSTTTSTIPPPPNISKIEEKKDPKDGDTILSSNTDNGNTVATKVDKSSKTETFNFNRGYVLGFASALDPGLSKVFKQKLDLMGMVYNAYPEEFKNGFMLGFVSGSDYLNTFGLLG